MEIKNYAEIYHDPREGFRKEEVEDMNEWLKDTGVRIEPEEPEEDEDGMTLRIFKDT